MTAPRELIELVRKYVRHRSEYRLPNFNETQSRVEFIDPLFTLLDWDVANIRGYAEGYKHVVHEARVSVEGKTKAPDYAFRIGGTRKFFLEAKRPSVNLSSDATAAFQLRRYAWSANLVLSVLTNFEELILFDTTIKPARSDRASKARAKLFRFDEYEARWDELYELLSPEGIQLGTFDRFAAGAKTRRGSAAVDAAFLAEIEAWRSALARDLARHNPRLNVRDLNFCVQAIIDRIVFLRIAEDRGIERYGQLKASAGKGGIYKRLFELFHAAERRYNSGLFHFEKASPRDQDVDDLTPTLRVSDDILRGILDGIYYPESPYEFSAFPADILGQVYERFLGKVIVLRGREATIEEKPEVKKAGGVYYTPTYIVRYIVEGTVGRALTSFSLNDITGKKRKNGQPFRVIDPACGSGSFLIEVYQCLLDWYLAKYLEKGAASSSRGKRAVIHKVGDHYRLTIAERKRILLDHIYGVDIDPQAVEVTKLSLLLKVLEGESSDAISKQMDLFHDRALPNLDENIKCGNSLISPAFFELYPRSLFSENEVYEVNVFDWREEFRSAAAADGFDVVLGNPPYFSIDATWGAGDRRLAALKSLYPQIHTDKTDVYYYFFAKAVEMSQAQIGFIVSRAFLEALKATKLRGYLLQHTGVKEIVDFQNFSVFEGVGITTAIAFLSKSERPSMTNVVKVRSEIAAKDRSPAFLATGKGPERFLVPSSSFGADPWHLQKQHSTDLYGRIDAAGERLSRILILGQGMQTGANEVFGNLTSSDLKRLNALKKLYRRRIRNTDIRPFHVIKRDEFLLYLEDEKSFAGLPAGVRNYLRSRERKLKERAAYERGDCQWWRYTWPLNRQLYVRDRIVCPYLATENRFAVVSGFDVLGLTDTTVAFSAEQPEDLRYICALLNSELLSLRFRGIGKLKSNGIYEYFDNSIGRLPIRRINFSNSSEVKLHEEVVELYDKMAEANRRLSAGVSASAAQTVEAEMRKSKQRLETVVAMLYGVPRDLLAVEHIKEEEAAVTTRPTPSFLKKTK
jgi:type I restriction-modification system DNA methylase subunit